MKTLIEIIGFLFNIIGITFLYFSSIPKPWNIQSFNGTTPKEKSYENKRILQRKLGTIFLVAGIIFMFSYTNNIIVRLLTNFILSISLYLKG